MAFTGTEVAATKLQAARVDRGWKQTRVITMLQRQAEIDQTPIASPKSLKTMLSRWENGEGLPGPTYRELFCKVYDASLSDLGLDDGLRDLASNAPDVAPAAGTAMAEYFRNVLVQHVRADNLMGPHHLVDVVRAQAALLDQVLPNSRGSLRAELLVLACRYNEFTGWLYQDAGHPDRAMAYTDRAMDYALEIGDLGETAYVLMRKTNIACDADRADRAVGLADAALRDAEKISSQIRALILGQRSRALAMLGDVDDCARSLDQAFREITRPSLEPDERAGYSNLAYVELEAAGCWHYLGRPGIAIPIFERSSSNLPALQRRDQGMCLARLANAHAAQHNPAQACTTGRQAVDVVRTATSARSLRELQRLNARLVPWTHDADVADLTHQIRGLLRPA